MMAKNKMTAREGALEVLLQLEREGEQVERALNRSDELLAEDRDRRFRRALVYAVLENRRFIDFTLNRFAKKKIEKQKPVPRALLRLGAAEILFLQTPPHAAVSETVLLAGRRASFARGFINAILRNLLREGDGVFTIQTGNKWTDLGIRYSFPDWMVELFSASFGPEDLEAVLRLSNTPSPISVFVNPQKIERMSALSAWRPVFSDLRPSQIAAYGLLMNGGEVTESEPFQEGMMTIQSAPSQRVAEIATEGMHPGRILDLCAAPGSKSVAMACLCPEAQVISNDLVPEKIAYIEENAKRLQVALETSVRDARIFVPEWEAAFDVVLVDAPCSGLGLVGRKPDIRWNRQKEDIAVLSALQKEIVGVALRYVRPGGRLVYSTCTYGEAENEDIAKWIDQQSGFKREAIDDGKEREVLQLTFSPLVEQADGFFMARWRRDG